VPKKVVKKVLREIGNSVPSKRKEDEVLVSKKKPKTAVRVAAVESSTAPVTVASVPVSSDSINAELQNICFDVFHLFPVLDENNNETTIPVVDFLAKVMEMSPGTPVEEVEEILTRWDALCKIMLWEEGGVRVIHRV
jgi:hypothetical protein